MKAYEFLLEKGINKVHQPNKRYNLSVHELITFLDELAQREKKLFYKPIEIRMYRNLSYLVKGPINQNLIKKRSAIINISFVLKRLKPNCQKR